jgi:hypothetical protein
MGQCLTYEEHEAALPTIKNYELSTQSSSTHIGFDLEIIPPSEIDHNENLAKIFA